MINPENNIRTPVSESTVKGFAFIFVLNYHSGKLLMACLKIFVVMNRIFQNKVFHKMRAIAIFFVVVQLHEQEASCFMSAILIEGPFLNGVIYWMAPKRSQRTSTLQVSQIVPQEQENPPFTTTCPFTTNLFQRSLQVLLEGFLRIRSPYSIFRSQHLTSIQVPLNAALDTIPAGSHGSKKSVGKCFQAFIY